MNTKLHAIADAKWRPLKVFMTAGEVCDCTAAAALLGHMQKA
jgi:transposase